MFAECTIQYDTKKGGDIYVFVEKTNSSFSFFSTKAYVVGTHLKCLCDAFLMSTTTCFHGEIRKTFT